MRASPTSICGAVAAAAQAIHEALPVEYVASRIVAHCIAAAAVSLGLYFAADARTNGAVAIKQSPSEPQTPKEDHTP